MPNLGSVAPGGPDWVPRRIKALEDRIKALETARPLAQASANFDGTIDPPAVGTQGWALTRSGDAIISGSLFLGAGLVGDDALQNPVRGKVLHGQATGFSVTTTYTIKATASVAVPAGFTRALVSATFVANARNTRGFQDYLAGYVDIPGYDATGDLVQIGDTAPGYVGAFIASKAGLITGLGSDVTVNGVLNASSGTWTADSFNSAVIDALVLFLR